MERTFATYPLFIKDPYFSIWAKDEELVGNNPVFWAGSEKPMRGYIRSGEREWTFFGKGEKTLTQRYIKTEGFVTECSFTGEDFDLTIEFVSPLFLNDLERLSCPVCYLKYTIEAKRELKDAEICFEIDEAIAYNTEKCPDRREVVSATVVDFGKFESAYVGLYRQQVFSNSTDTAGADWGYWYLTGETCSVKTVDERTVICASNALQKEGFFMLGFDDVVSVNYFGRPLVGYYFRKGKTMSDALEDSFENAWEIFDECRRQYGELKAEWSRHGEDYLTLCNAAYAQSAAAHKLVYDPQTDKMLFLSKECGSCGCVATLDVSYPSAPMYLKYNPALVRGMLYPVFEFVKKRVWTYDFAPHDVGVYPLCFGQYYAFIQEGPTKYNNGAISWLKKETLCMPKVFDFPVNRDLYDYEKQMPVEESANVLILAYAAYKADGDATMLEEEYPILEKWANYLLANGKCPENQLTTDDFCGRKAKAINLTIKAAVGLYAFSEIAKQKGENGEKYLAAARDFASFVEDYSKGMKHMPSTFDLSDDTYSMKYNMAFDLWFGSNLFKTETYRKEAECYEKNLCKYGVKLYSDITTTKTDWMAFVACFSPDESYRKKLYASMTRAMRETPDRIPFCDWYAVETARPDGTIFRNRTVQGGIFMPLLFDEN